MSEKTPEELAAEAAAAEAAKATETPKATRRKLSAVAPTPEHKVYVTTQKHSYPFDIQISNEVIAGQWSKEDGYVEFLVPDHLVAGFEKHFHFVSGNIVAD